MTKTAARVTAPRIPRLDPQQPVVDLALILKLLSVLFLLSLLSFVCWVCVGIKDVVLYRLKRVLIIECDECEW